MEKVNLLTTPSKLVFSERWLGGVPAGRLRRPQFLPRNPLAVSVSAVHNGPRSNPPGYSFSSYVTGGLSRVLRPDCSKLRQSHKFKFGAFQAAFAVAAAAGIDMATCQTAETADSRTVVHESQSNGETLPELVTEFMVDMKCEGCVTAVRNSLENLDGVRRVDVDLPNQVVRVLGSASIKTLTDAFEQSSRKARLIGQGNPEDFLVSAAVAEFKGPKIFGVVRFAQVNMELARVEANFSGLSPGRHGWSINEFGDLTKGAASTGQIFSLPNVNGSLNEPLGNLGTLDVGDNGEALFSGLKYKLKVADLIGRAVVLYDTEDMSCVGTAAAVIARSAGVGQNYKKICTCDGTVIWESSNSDFVKV